MNGLKSSCWGSHSLGSNRKSVELVLRPSLLSYLECLFSVVRSISVGAPSAVNALLVVSSSTAVHPAWCEFSICHHVPRFGELPKI